MKKYQLVGIFSAISLFLIKFNFKLKTLITYLKYTFFFLLFFVVETVAQPCINTSGSQKNGFQNISDKVLYQGFHKKFRIDSLRRINGYYWSDNAGHKTLNMGVSPNVFWFKFKIVNDDLKKEKFYLFLSNKGINDLELFQERHHQFLNLGVTGDHHAFHQRPVVSNYFVYPIDIQSKDTVEFYLYCDKQNENLNTKILLYTENEFVIKENKALIFMGFFIGFLLLSMIISFYLYYVSREKLHFWYGWYILAVINLLLSYEGYDFQYFFPDYPFYSNISRFVASSMTLGIMTYVMQLFCQQKPENSKFYYPTNIIRMVVFILIPITLMVYWFFPYYALKSILFYIFIGLQFAGILIILFSTLEKMIQKYKPAIFYFIAVITLLYSGVLATIREIGYLDSEAGSPNQLQWCFILEVLIISIGILYRYTLVKKDNENLFQELNQLRINSIKQIFEAQQKEQQRIAEDLHDMFGGQLAALKHKITAMLEDPIQTNSAIQIIDELSNNTRTIAHNLNPIQLNNNAIADIIALYVTQLNQEQSIHFEFIQTGQPEHFKKEVEIALYKITMEIIYNALKHSNASDCSIQFFYKEDELEIITEDNGVGISGESVKGMGLKNIAKRIKKINGNIHIDSKKGNTTIIITIPSPYENA